MEAPQPRYRLVIKPPQSGLLGSVVWTPSLVCGNWLTAVKSSSCRALLHARLLAPEATLLELGSGVGVVGMLLATLYASSWCSPTGARYSQTRSPPMPSGTDSHLCGAHMPRPTRRLALPPA